MVDRALSLPPRHLRAAEGLPRRVVVQLAALGLLMYLAAAAVVRYVDHLSVGDQIAQIREQGGPLFSTACVDCVGTSGSVLAWITDERAVLVWLLIAVATTIGVAISRRGSRPA